MKPFRVPSIIRRPPREDPGSGPHKSTSEPPAKKRRISNERSVDDDVAAIAAASQILKKPKATGSFKSPVARQPLHVVRNPSNPATQSAVTSNDGSETYYTVLW
nr:hypothetical protein CFP56_30949 [Quercus suber]